MRRRRRGLARGGGGRVLGVFKTQRTCILCVGDSNTYGLYLRDRDQEAYPSQLERSWNADPNRTPIEVLNLGYPGVNSSRLIRDLSRMLDVLSPEVVMIMIGSNDYWTASVSAANETSATSPVTH